MLKKLAYVLSAALLSTAVACGGGSGSDPDPDVDPDNGNEPDTTSPTIVSTSPEVGASGVREDAAVTIDFSEPMDKESVEATLDASELGDHAIEWNDAGDQITITPDSPLVYGQGIGTDHESVDAETYSVVLGSAATDLAGNPLGSGVDVYFSTLKEMVLVVEADQLMTASISPAEILYDQDDELVVGDNADDVGIRSVLTFDISELPEETVEISEAYVLSAPTGDGLGTPWTDLGDSVLIDHVMYDSLDTENDINTAFNSSQVSLASYEGFCTEGIEYVEFGVQADVQDDFENRDDRGDLSQYLLYFATANDENGDTDRVVFSRDKLRLDIRYLVE